MSLIKTVELPSFALVWTTLQTRQANIGAMNKIVVVFNIDTMSFRIHA